MRNVPCVCGKGDFYANVRGMPALKVCTCALCGTERLDYEILPEGVLETYRSGAYHESTTRHPGVVPYKERRDHDLAVGRTRVARYLELIGSTLYGNATLLDVGAANGAFVEAAAGFFRAGGIDPDPQHPVVERSTIEGMRGRQYDVVTYHDVLEHVYDPRRELAMAVNITSPTGWLIVDVPDVYGSPVSHHYKLEHLWYFSMRGLVDLIRWAGCDVCHIDVPVTGKLVVYGRRKP